MHRQKNKLLILSEDFPRDSSLILAVIANSESSLFTNIANCYFQIVASNSIVCLKDSSELLNQFQNLF